jgi:sialic acid synthase SpsE
MRTRIILETGCNHQGEMQIAKEIILDAHKLGVWGIKFQKRDIESMPDDLKNRPRDMSTSFGPTYYEHRKKLEFDIDQLQELKNLAHRKGLKFICSAFDEKSANDLIKLGCDFIKLPSQLYMNDSMRNKLKQGIVSRDKVIVSTGMHTIDEILDSPWMIEAFLVMHCISIYPARLSQLELSVIDILKRHTKNVGYSSHDINGEAIKYAVLCGARYIERHYTLSKSMKGSDHETVSSDFKEMLKIIKDIEYIETLLGNGKTKLHPDELCTRKIYINE